MSGNVQEISSAIRNIVVSASRLPGARLAAALKTHHPEWSPADFGVRNLREFVTTHVQGVVIVGNAGLDVVYGIEGAETAHAPDVAPSQASQPDFWRIWVSSNSPFAIVVDRASATPKAVPRGTAVVEDQVILEPPGVEMHRSVAREFLSQVPEEMRPRLLTIVDQPTDAWWQTWVRELRGSSLLASWNTFRRDAFEKQLCSELRAAKFSKPSIDRVLAMIQERPLRTSQNPRPSPPLFSAERIEGVDVRRVVLEAVRRMSVAELRDLRLPVGIVFDVLTSPKSR